MEIFLLAALLGLIPAFIANSKGRSMFLWWIYGTLLFIIALPHSMLASDLLQERLDRENAPSQIRITKNPILDSQTESKQPFAQTDSNTNLMDKVVTLNSWKDSGRINKEQYDALLNKIPSQQM